MMNFKYIQISDYKLAYNQLKELCSNYELISSYKKGSKIYIKKKNRGKFTASAKAHGMGVQEYATKVLNDPNATPLQKKRANFARNAKRFKH